MPSLVKRYYNWERSIIKKWPLAMVNIAFLKGLIFGLIVAILWT